MAKYYFTGSPDVLYETDADGDICLDGKNGPYVYSTAIPKLIQLGILVEYVEPDRIDTLLREAQQESGAVHTSYTTTRCQINRIDALLQEIIMLRAEAAE